MTPPNTIPVIFVVSSGDANDAFLTAVTVSGAELSGISEIGIGVNDLVFDVEAIYDFDDGISHGVTIADLLLSACDGCCR